MAYSQTEVLYSHKKWMNYNYKPTTWMNFNTIDQQKSCRRLSDITPFL